MEKPLISIIVPIYNLSDCLEKSIKSIISQDYKNIEIILIDDGSTDNSLDICKKLYEIDFRIKIFKQQNKGVSSARNLGIKNARGKYITFIDGDDIVSKTLISKMYNYISLYKADLVTVGIAKNIQELQNNEVSSFKIYNQYETLKKLPIDCLKGIGYASWGKLFLTDLVKDILFDENTGMCEDYLFVVNYITKIKLAVIIQEKLYCYIKRENSATQKKFTQKRLDIIYSNNKILNIISNRYFDLLPYYRCSFLNGLISLKNQMIKNNANTVFRQKVENEINSLLNSYFKGSKKARAKILLYKINKKLCFFLMDFYHYIYQIINH